MSAGEHALRNERILVIEDDPGVGESVMLLLRSMGCGAELANHGAAALARAQSEPFDLVISDLRLPDIDGLEILRTLKASALELPVILMTSYSSLDGAIQALRAGAIDYVIKPFSNDEFRHAVERALDEQRTRRENARLKRDLKKVIGAPGILGDTPAIRRVLDLIARVGPSDANVLIQGESGTGKELVAQAMDGAGTVTIESCRLTTGDACVSIRDTGPGIAPGHLARLFEPFFTTKPTGSGTGLGLAISNEIVLEHGGSLDAENYAAGGACFHVRLPLSEADR